jgi:hypothetical protein
MDRRIMLGFVLLGILLVSLGCQPMGTLNGFRRVSLVDFTVVPHKAGRVAPQSLTQLREASTRWIRSNTFFDEVANGADGRPDTVYVQGTVINYRPHRRGTTALRVFGGVDIRGESLIDYRFFDAMGRTIMVRRIHSRYRRGPAGVDATAEGAAAELARFVGWHKTARTVYVPPPQ